MHNFHVRCYYQFYLLFDSVMEFLSQEQNGRKDVCCFCIPDTLRALVVVQRISVSGPYGRAAAHCSRLSAAVGRLVFFRRPP